MTLPAAFIKRMEALLGAEAGEFFHSYNMPHYRGIRRNPLKASSAILEKSLPFAISPAPFSPLSYYVPGEEKLGLLPAHHGGMFYVQEPSAAAAVTVLSPKPYERVLDLCAAPGGKSTQIAGLMEGKGLLWANEIVKSRANILLSNIERMGVANAVVSSCHPEKLCSALEGYFHRVLVDAPCSGEGMFRRDPAAVKEWREESPAACAQRQQAILRSAAKAVASGGVLVYSTCTFSKEENEEIVSWFLSEHRDFEIDPIEITFGRRDFENLGALRILPMDGGEGHFVARFRRRGDAPCNVKPFAHGLSLKDSAPARELYSSLFTDACPESIGKAGEKLLLLPQDLPDISGLGVLRAGVELGEIKGKRIAPSHPVFMSRQQSACRAFVDFAPNDPLLAAFLRGEEIPCESKGYTAVCVNGVVTGFGKASGGMLKNHYPKGLRNLTDYPLK